MSASQLDRASVIPLWLQLQQDLAARVAAGEFAGVFPSELALADEYQLSRHTVRQALRQLRSAGLVTGSRGRPSRVAEPATLDHPVGVLYSLLATARAAGMSITSKIRSFGVLADGVVAPRLQLEESAPLVCLDRVRLADDLPLAHDQLWLPAALGEPLLDLDFSTASVYDHLAGRSGVRLDGGEEHISAVSLTASQCRLLDCPPGTGGFAVRRLGLARGRPVEWRSVLIRGDRFPLAAAFTARGGYQLAGTAPG